ncbi:hypothetical protein [Paraburkholderia sp. J8-2]|uniref:hypothetical protein n=1 Tax=Paraburkholderia sp. J8-2 TaxID=2805440 RepID=UPI002AB6C245|nr:hypothetical protein [Paraburkholderia sp. J8-2]
MAMSRDREFISLKLEDVAGIVGFVSSQTFLEIVKSKKPDAKIWPNKLEAGELAHMMPVRPLIEFLSSFGTDPTDLEEAPDSACSEAAARFADWLAQEYPDGKDLKNLTPEARRSALLHSLLDLRREDPSLDAAGLAAGLNADIHEVKSLLAQLHLYSRLRRAS